MHLVIIIGCKTDDIREDLPGLLSCFALDHDIFEPDKLFRVLGDIIPLVLGNFESRQHLLDVGICASLLLGISTKEKQVLLVLVRIFTVEDNCPGVVLRAITTLE